MGIEPGDLPKSKQASKTSNVKNRKRGQSIRSKDSPDYKFRKLNLRVEKHSENENVDTGGTAEAVPIITNGLPRKKDFENSTNKPRASSRDCKETAMLRMRYIGDSCEQLEVDVQDSGVPWIQSDSDSCDEDSAKDDKYANSSRSTGSSGENSAKVSPSSKILEEFNSK